jgi:hypothetical protein
MSDCPGQTAEDVATLQHAMRAETEEYQRFCTMLRTLRRLFGRNEHDAARSVCEGLLATARELELRARERQALGGLKQGVAHTEEEHEAQPPELREAGARLLEAQMVARSELVTTLDTIGDLRTHAVSLRAALEGRIAATYDSRGQMQMAGGGLP